METENLTPPIPRTAWLIDLDNVPSCLQECSKQWLEHDLVLLFHGAQEPRVPMSVVQRLADRLARTQMKVVAMTRGGDQAADMALAVYAGLLHHSLPPETEIVVVSNDLALTHVVTVLTGLGRTSRRVTMNAKPVAVPPVRSDDGDRALHQLKSEVVEWLRKRQSAPKKLDTLRRALRRWRQWPASNSVERIVEALVQDGVIHVKANKYIEYRFGLRAVGAEELPPHFDDDIPF